MAGLRVKELWRAAGGAAFLLYLVAVAAGLVKVVDQPSLDVGVAGTTVALVPADLLLAAVGVVALVRLARGRAGRLAHALPLAALLFAAWLFATALPNGSEAVVAAGRLLELGVLALATIVLVERPLQLWLLVGTLAAMATAAVGIAFIGFLGDPGARQASFLGEHDLAALSTMVATVGLAAVAARDRRDRLAWAACVVGAVGITLGAALAGVLGLYLAAAAILVVAAVRRSLHRRAVVAALVMVVAVTAGTLAIRSGDLGFLQVLAGREERQPGEFAASWSQRLIYVYVGARVFEDNAIAGTGWYPLLPPSAFAGYLHDARARFPDQPPGYFPDPGRDYIPQQTLDQVLYELGLVGAVLFLALAVAVARTAWRRAVRRPWREGDTAAYVPIAWSASLAGVLAGAALFGGTPIATIFWLTLGTVAAAAHLGGAGAAA